jgi:hypothetical protein
VQEDAAELQVCPSSSNPRGRAGRFAPVRARLKVPRASLEVPSGPLRMIGDSLGVMNDALQEVIRGPTSIGESLDLHSESEVVTGESLAMKSDPRRASRASLVVLFDARVSATAQFGTLRARPNVRSATRVARRESPRARSDEAFTLSGRRVVISDSR